MPNGHVPGNVYVKETGTTVQTNGQRRIVTTSGLQNFFWFLSWIHVEQYYAFFFLVLTMQLLFEHVVFYTQFEHPSCRMCTSSLARSEGRIRFVGRTRITGVWVNTALVNLLGELLAEMMLGYLIRVGVGTYKFHNPFRFNIQSGSMAFPNFLKPTGISGSDSGTRSLRCTSTKSAQSRVFNIIISGCHCRIEYPAHCILF